MAHRDQLRGPGPHPVSAGGIDLVLVETPAGDLRAFEGRCPHQGALLGEGELDGDRLVCRNHRWRFDATTGRRVGGPQCLRAFPVREQDGEIHVQVPAATAVAPALGLRQLDDLPAPAHLPLLGNLLQLRPARLHLQLEEWALELGSAYTVRMGPRRAVVLSDPDLTQQALRERPQLFRRVDRVEPFFREVGAAGVFSAEGDAWRAQRRLAMEALSPGRIRGFYPTLARVAERLRARWLVAASRKDGEIDIREDLMRFTVDVTTALALGRDVNTVEGGDDVIQQHLSQVFPAVQRRITAPFPYWRWLRLPADRRLDRSLDLLRVWLSGIVEETRALLARDPDRAARPENFLEAMLTARGADGNPFSEQEILGNAMTMLLAGEDTTANAVAWAVHLLCDDAEATAELRREVDALLPAEQRVPPTLEAASQLLYARAVSQETMRLKPVAPLMLLQSSQDAELGDLALPSGTIVIILLRVPVLAASRFEQPTGFRPTRWLQGERDSAFMPFGSGPRICPGRSLALVEMQVLLATLFRSFEVERIGASLEVREGRAFTVFPQGLRVRLHARA